jgi:hypothetical protein
MLLLPKMLSKLLPLTISSWLFRLISTLIPTKKMTHPSFVLSAKGLLALKLGPGDERFVPFRGGSF